MCCRNPVRWTSDPVIAYALVQVLWRPAWLGMDAPVPGVMTEDYEPDAALCAFIVADGLQRGATSFLADIELPSMALL